MSIRPERVEIDSAQQSWDSPLNDNLAILFDGPLPVYEAATVTALLAIDPSDYVNCLVVTEDTEELWKSDGSDWRLIGQRTGVKNANGARYYDVVETNELTLSGADETWSGAFPAGSLERALSLRVTQLVTSGDGATDFDVGDGTDVDMFANAVAFAATTTKTPADRTADPNGIAAKDVVITAVGGTFSGGKVRLCAAYKLLTAPTS